MFRKNRLRTRLAAGHHCRAAWLFTGSPDNADILGHAGYDALIIDQEHSSYGIETAVHQMRAIRSAGQSTILARLASNNLDQIKLLLDAGVEGLLLPTAESAEEVREFVAACRYPPGGRRGAHFTVSRAAGWGNDTDRYYQRVESELLLVAMIESEKGVRAISGICGIEGIDMLFLGPLDLSGSIGKMGQWAAPEVQALTREAESAALANGRLLGGALVPGETAADCFARGYRFVTVGSDVGILREGAFRSLQDN